MTVDTAVVLAALVLVLLWPTHQQLTIRALRHAIRQQHKQLHQHRRAIVQLQSAAVRPPTSIGQPMPSVTGTHRAIGGTADPDRTLRLARPPALTDIEAVLAEAGRALTATEMATKLGRKPWDCLPELDRLLKAGAIRTVPGHTAGRTAYELADPAESTERMPRCGTCRRG